MLGGFDLSWWGYPAAASSSYPISICRHVEEAEVDSLCAEMHVLPVSSFRGCPKFLGPHQGFPYPYFPSLVERRELCRYTSESAGVARLAPCPIGRPSLPARYALGVGERCGGWPASQWHTIPALRLRPHQWLAPSSFALPHMPIRLVLSREAPQGSGPAFASGDMVDASDATGICSITEQPSLSP